ncbi:hypothetical protein V5799_000651 [Amblyomma americanum]|uniref:Uncharacterized protein n=1 Tax=Amblyomma americanum TaxID=6943 RepID=A0AAQ4D2F7_AMBAM
MAADFGLQFFAGARTDVQRNNAAAVALSESARQSVGQFGGAVLFLLTHLLGQHRLCSTGQPVKALLQLKTFFRTVHYCTRLSSACGRSSRSFHPMR